MINPISQKKRTLSGDIKLIILLIGSVFLIPFLYSTSTIDPVLLPRFFAWSVLTFILSFIVTIQSAKGCTSKEFSNADGTFFLIFICYFFVSALSMTKAVNVTEGIFELMKTFLSFTFLYITAIIIGNNEDGICLLTRSVIISGMILAVIGILQYYRLAFNFIPGNYYVYATMAHKNLFASALFLTTPFVLYGVLIFPGSWRIVSLISLLCIMFAITIAEARTVWGSAVLSTVLTAIVLIYVCRKKVVIVKVKRFRFNQILIFFATFVMVIITAIFSHYLYAKKISREMLSTRNVSVEEYAPFTTSITSFDTLKERFSLWEKTFNMIKSAPFLGVGPGQWKVVLPQYGMITRKRKTEKGVSEIVFLRPHNDYLWVLSETGSLGFFFYLAIFLKLLHYLFKIILKSEDTDKKIFSALMLFGITGYMAISFFSFPKERIVHNIFFILMATCVLSVYNQEFSNQRTLSFHNSMILNSMLFLFLAFCLFGGYIRLISEIHARNALTASENRDWHEVISEINKASLQFYNMDPVSMPLSWYRGIARISLGQRTEALEDFKKAYEVHPNNIYVLNNLGTSYVKVQDYKRAIEFYKKALTIFPRFEEALINLGIVYCHMGINNETNDCIFRTQIKTVDP